MNKQRLTIAVLVSGLFMASIPASAVDSYQQRVLLSPSAEILQAEARGRVMIYDGLKNETVEKALDNQFDRIENMIFVRTVHIQENGEFEVDDDCD